MFVVDYLLVFGFAYYSLSFISFQTAMSHNGTEDMGSCEAIWVSDSEPHIRKISEGSER